MNNIYPKGSEWRKWDLHIHSPFSLLNNQFPKTLEGHPDWEVYLQRLEASDLVVVGVTDYFTIDGYKKLKAFKTDGRLANIHTLLPNVEFRLNSLISSKKDGEEPRRLNFHVLFSDEVLAQDIEEHFLHDLHFYYEGNPQDKDETRKLKLSNIEALGARLIKEHKPFQDGRSAAEIGAMNTVVSHEEITTLLQNDSRFRGKYLIGFPEELSNLISWDGQDHHIRKSLLQKSDLVFSSNQKTRTWCLGLDPYMEGPDAYSKEFKTLKPCVHGSDAHSIERIGVPCARRGQAGHDCSAAPQECDLRHCWIKADPTFEGFKQLLYEPGERVTVQATNPTPIKSNHCIDRIEISAARVNDELSVQATVVPINSGLVAVTGGKGSGKTALVDLLANCYVDRRNTSDTNSFVRRISGDEPDITVTIGFRDGTQFTKKVTDAQVFDASKVVYIAQGELEEYIGDSSDLERYVNELIFESPQVKNSVKAFEYEALTGEIRRVQDQISGRHDVIEKLELQTAETVSEKLNSEKRRTEAALRDVEQQIQAFETQLSADKIELTRGKQQTMAELQRKKEQAHRLRTLLDKAERFVTEALPEFRRNVSEINSSLRALGISDEIADLNSDDLVKLRSARTAVDTVLRDVVIRIEAGEREVKTFEADMREHSKQLGRKGELQEQLRQIAEQLTKLDEDGNRLAELRRERTESFTTLVQKIVGQRDKYAELIGVFASEKTMVLSDLDFLAELKFDSRGLLLSAQDVLDNRQVEVMGSERGRSVFEELQSLYGFVLEGQTARIPDLVQETDRLAAALRSKVKGSQAITTGNLYKALYGTYLTVTPVVTYKKTRLSKLSLGQKATVLMKIYLAQGTDPIVIDSHDDHLDNEFIMEELVGAIRQAKGYRQVILASNNGNVVVNSDAEQIIIANRIDGEISYVSGAIEAPTIRERALKVLEGGDLAFKKRQEKYRIGSYR